MGEIFLLGVKEACYGMGIHSSSKCTDVQLIELSYAVQEGLSVRTYLGMIPQRFWSMPQLKVKHILKGTVLLISQLYKYM